ncbi:SusC/RagA family TonB-linked outer membrane protein [Flagellimonas pacifica]|uniref:TonB-linked outer membrane protein, SusC/RagA family n=1 Tax=Flagellimonas pacifica TaxID=1247520 RepID=A0A285MV69_9FLAO|nr:TonB-dependent receptor [Allomuricauda parva]SNZ00427.1 TonB-linked outer membrane protein, SusC/RagA family [Allomuricauda parva]
MKNRTLNLLIPLFLFSIFSWGQEKSITGTVVDGAGAPVIGANVIIKDKARGAVTDFDGKFTIGNVASQDVLTISSIGYVTQEIVIGNQTDITVTLQEDVSQLEEVVVVAYGTQKKETVTSSLVSIKSEELTDVTTPEVSSMLQGKAAGVQVTASGGGPGSQPSILIRGVASLNGQVTPLWVVDGVIQHGAPVINPNDVADISLLKDASATALYGSRGANGVVLVTTKRGKIGAKPQLNISSKVGINQFTSGPFKVMDSQQLYDYHQEMGIEQSWFSEDLLGRDNDWLEGGTKDAIVNDHNATFTAATDKLSLYLNGGYYNEEGTLRGNELDRFTFRTNLDYKISDKLTIKPKIAFSFDDRQGTAEAPLYELFLNLPWDQPQFDDGTFVNPNDLPVDYLWYGRDQRNYFFDQQWNYSDSNTFNLSANFDFEYKIIPNLSYISTNNFTLFRDKDFAYTDPRSNGGQADNGSIREDSANRRTRLTTQMLKYSNVFNDDHTINALVAFEYNDYDYEYFRAVGIGIVPGSQTIGRAAEAKETEGTRNDYAFQSFFAAADYDYKGRYFAKASLRRDGSSRFGKDNQYGTFFSFGAGWNIHKEDFFNAETINELKLRASYGSVGNIPTNLYGHQTLYSLSGNYDGAPGAILFQSPNPDLGWEQTYEANFALDTRFFNRLNLTLEYYHKTTTDLLWTRELPDDSGFDYKLINAADMVNKGFEAALSADLVQNDDLNINIGFNIGINNNEITGLVDDLTSLPVGNKIWEVGEDTGTWYIRKWLGVDPQSGLAQWEVVDEDTGETSETSDWNAATLQKVGTSTPDFIGGFNTNITYKGFSLRSNFSFSQGGTVYNASRQLFDSDGFYPTFNQMVLDDDWSRWQQPGDVATHPNPVRAREANGGDETQITNRRSSRYLEDGSYLRLNNVTFSYNLPKDVLSKIGLNNARIYVTGDNLFTLTKFTGADPTIANLANDTASDRGNISLGYPIPRRYALGLNLTF